MIELDRKNPLVRGLIIDVPLLEKGGTSIRDLLKNVSSGTATGTSWVQTPYGIGMDFGIADSSDRISFTSGSQINSLNRFTTEFLIKINSWGAQTDRIIEKGTAATPFWSVGATQNVPGRVQVATGFATANNTWYINGVTQGQWHHLVISCTLGGLNDQPKFYLDGKEVTPTQSASGSGAQNADTTNFLIGNTTGNNRGMEATLVYARVWKRILTASEAKSLYSNPWQIYKEWKRNITVYLFLGLVPPTLPSTPLVASAYMTTMTGFWGKF